MPEGERYLRAAPAPDPGRGVTYLNLARLAVATGRFADALALADTAISLNVGVAEASGYKWTSILALGDTTAMRGAWARVDAGNQLVSNDVLRGRTSIEEGLVALARGDSIRASESADSIVARKYSHGAGLVLLVRLGRGHDAALAGWLTRQSGIASAP